MENPILTSLYDLYEFNSVIFGALLGFTVIVPLLFGWYALQQLGVFQVFQATRSPSTVQAPTGPSVGCESVEVDSSVPNEGELGRSFSRPAAKGFRREPLPEQRSKLTFDAVSCGSTRVVSITQRRTP